MPLLSPPPSAGSRTFWAHPEGRGAGPRAARGPPEATKSVTGGSRPSPRPRRAPRPPAAGPSVSRPTFSSLTFFFFWP